MSILKTVQMFIAMNPGSTTRDIIEGLTQFSQTDSNSPFAACMVLGWQRVNATGDNSVTTRNRQQIATSKCLNQLLKSKGLFHRAATIYMEAFSVSAIESERAAILAERQRCLGLAKPAVITEDGCYLAGRFSGGR